MKTVDCRLAGIEGFGEHKKWCESVIAAFGDARIALVLSTDEPGIYYCHYSFPYEPTDAFKLKMLQSIGYLQRAWMHFAQSHDLKTVYAVGKEVMAAIHPTRQEIGRGPAFRLLDRPLPEALVPNRASAQAAENAGRGGFVDMMRGWFSRDWKTDLRAKLKPLSKDDYIDPSVLPDSRKQLRLRLGDELHRWFNTESNDTAKGLQLVELHSLLLRCHPLARDFYFVQAQLFATKDEEALLMHMTAFMTLGQGIRATCMMFHSIPALCGMFPDEAWKALIEMDEMTTPWRPYSVDPNYVMRNTLFKSEVVQKTVASMARSSERTKELHLEYGCYLADQDRYEEAIEELNWLAKSVGTSQEPQLRGIEVQALDRVCRIWNGQEDVEQLNAAVLRMGKALGSSSSGFDPTLWSEYRMRLYYWRSKALQESTVEELEEVFQQAREFAEDRVHRSMHTAGFLCYFARLHLEECILEMIKEEKKRALDCLLRGIHLLEPLHRYRIRGELQLISLEAFPVLSTLCAAADKLATELEVDLTGQALKKGLEATVNVMQWQHYKAATALTEMFPFMPEAKLEEEINEWVSLAKAAKEAGS